MYKGPYSPTECQNNHCYRTCRFHNKKFAAPKEQCVGCESLIGCICHLDPANQAKESFADTVRALEAKKIQEYIAHRDSERARLLPPLVEHIRKQIMKHVDEQTNSKYYRASIEFSQFGLLDDEQRDDLKKILASAPLNLSVRQSKDDDGSEYWVISWASKQ
jgi:hypothetical protein